MASWLKQGLSTLGEGLSSITKEILSEDIPPADGPLSSNGSTRRMTSTRAEDVPDKSAEQFQQMVKHYETLLADQRSRIAQLEISLPNQSLSNLPNGRSSSPEQSSLVDSTDHDKFLEIDLAATTPSPDHSRVESSFPVLSAAQIRHDNFHLPLAHKDSVESGLLEAMEEELREKDITIRHLKQEIARVKSELQENDLTNTVDASLHGNFLTDELRLLERITVESQTEKEVTEIEKKETQDAAVQFELAITSCDETSQTTDTSAFTVLDDQHDRGKEQTETSSQTEPSTEENFSVLQKTENQSVAESQPDEIPAVTSQDVALQADGQVNQAIAECQTDEIENMTSPAEQLTVQSTAESQTDEITTVTSHDVEIQVDQAINQTTFDSPPEVISTDAAVQAGEQVNQATAESQTVETGTVMSRDADVQVGEQVDQTTTDCQTDEIPSTPSEHSEAQTESSGSLISSEEYTSIQAKNHQLEKEAESAVEARERLRKENERLKGHLLQVEQGFAQDFEGAQKREEELRQMVEQLQAQVGEGLSLQQQASSGVNNQIATLEREVRVLLEARDAAVAKFHQAETNAAQSETSLSNLRMAFEHIKLEQRSELELERQKARKSFKSLEEKLAEVVNRNARLEEQSTLNLQEQAELDRFRSEAESLRQQLATMSSQLQTAERAVQAANEESSISSQSKVESALMKSMLLGFLIGPKNIKADILRMMMSTLNFSDNEKQKVQYSQSSSLGTLFSRPISGQVPEDSFSNLLVKFVEQQSQPTNAEEVQTNHTPLMPLATDFSPPRPSPPSLLNLPARPPMRPSTSLHKDMLESALNDDQLDANVRPSRSSVEDV